MLSSDTGRYLIFIFTINILESNITIADDPTAENNFGSGTARCIKMTEFWHLSAAQSHRKAKFRGILAV
jgi:hypothetical protein